MVRTESRPGLEQQVIIFITAYPRVEEFIINPLDIPSFVIFMLSELNSITSMEESEVKQAELWQIFNEALININRIKYRLIKKEGINLGSLPFYIETTCSDRKLSKKSGANIITNSLAILRKGSSQSQQPDNHSWENQTLSLLSPKEIITLTYEPFAPTSVPGHDSEMISFGYADNKGPISAFSISREFADDGRYSIKVERP